MLGATGSCGGRTVGLPRPSPREAGTDAAVRSPEPPLREAGSYASVRSTDAGPGVRDESFEASVTDAHAIDVEIVDSGSSDARNDGPSDAGPDCRCPPGDYFIDADIGGTRLHLTAPYRLYLACEETAAQLIHSRCGKIDRLSGCAATDASAACLYVAVGEAGPINGTYTDGTGQTWELQTGAVSVASWLGRVATGTWSANFVNRTDGGSLAGAGTFRACVPRLPACK
jgi:hypothetical protein